MARRIQEAEQPVDNVAFNAAADECEDLRLVEAEAVHHRRAVQRDDEGRNAGCVCKTARAQRNPFGCKPGGGSQGSPERVYFFGRSPRPARSSTAMDMVSTPVRIVGSGTGQ